MPPWRNATAALVEWIEYDTVGAHPFEWLATRLARLHTPPELLVRIDDAIALDEPLRWLLDALARRGVRASLEVVPGLCTFDDRELDALDPDALFEVSQHGVDHVPHHLAPLPPFEFPHLPTAGELECESARIERGRAGLVARFPRRFAGGFSPPYDSMPDWVPTIWRRANGRFVSTIEARLSHGSTLPVLRVPGDVWDWTHDRLRSPAAIAHGLASDAALRGRATLVLHHEVMTARHDRTTLERFLDVLLAPQRVGIQTPLRAYPLRVGAMES